MDKLAQIKDDKSVLIQTAEEKWKAVHPLKTKKGDGAGGAVSAFCTTCAFCTGAVKWCSSAPLGAAAPMH